MSCSPDITCVIKTCGIFLFPHTVSKEYDSLSYGSCSACEALFLYSSSSSKVSEKDLGVLDVVILTFKLSKPFLNISFSYNNISISKAYSVLRLCGISA